MDWLPVSKDDGHGLERSKVPGHPEGRPCAAAQASFACAREGAGPAMERSPCESSEHYASATTAVTRRIVQHSCLAAVELARRLLPRSRVLCCIEWSCSDTVVAWASASY